MTKIHDGTADLLEVTKVQKEKTVDEEKVGEDEDIGSRVRKIQFNQTIKVLT